MTIISDFYNKHTMKYLESFLPQHCTFKSTVVTKNLIMSFISMNIDLLFNENKKFI